MKLNSLYIKSFRGATKPLTVEFDLSKKITMLFGENGNGKSTIADALVCLCTENLGSIQDKSSIDKSYIKSIGAASGETKITLSTDSNTFSATISGSGKTFSKFPLNGQPQLKYLRRSQIIGLINAPATERYKELKGYIEVENIESSEEALRKLQKDINSEFSTSTRVLNAAQSTLEQIWEKEGKPDHNYSTWSKLEYEKDTSKESIKYNGLKSILSQWQNIIAKHEEIEELEGKEIELKESINLFSIQVAQIESAAKGNDSQLLKVLQEARKYISGQTVLNACPICSNEINRDAIFSALTDQISSMDELQSLAKDLEKEKNNLETNTESLEEFHSKISQKLITFCTFIGKYSDKYTEIANFVNSIHTNVDAVDNYLAFVEQLDGMEAIILKIETKASQILNNISQHNNVSIQYKAILDNYKKCLYLENFATNIDKALKIVAKSRKDYVDNELESISTEVEQMYQKIHPNEGLGEIKLFLKQNFKNSLELNATFHSEHNIAPQSVYSESHLDTLGICIFLALAKKYSDGNTILLLDDVVMSVDENHLDRFIQLLHDEAYSFSHIIITTHYRPWRDRYRTHRAPEGKVQFIELLKWSKETGIRIQNGRVQLQELEMAVNDANYFDRQTISSKSGLLLENFLDYLSDLYEYHLPKRKSYKYTLGELIDTLQPKYLKHIKTVHIYKYESQTDEIEYQIQPIIEELKKLIFIRNQVGAHFNLEDNASDEDVERFGRKTLELGRALVCPNTGQLPLTKKVDHFKTPNGSIRLYPCEKLA